MLGSGYVGWEGSGKVTLKWITGRYTVKLGGGWNWLGIMSSDKLWCLCRNLPLTHIHIYTCSCIFIVITEIALLITRNFLIGFNADTQMVFWRKNEQAKVMYCRELLIKLDSHVCVVVYSSEWQELLSKLHILYLTFMHISLINIF